MAGEDRTDEELFYLASRGDDEAFIQLLTRIDYVYKLLTYMCRLYSEPEDAAFAIAHATVRKACQKIQSRPLPRRKWRKMWLRKIARRQFEIWIEENRGSIASSTPTPEPQSPSAVDFQSERFNQIVENKFGCMVGDSRVILKLVLRHGYSMVQLGERFDCSCVEAEVLYYNALAELLSWIENHDEFQ